MGIVARDAVEERIAGLTVELLASSQGAKMAAAPTRSVYQAPTPAAPNPRCQSTCCPRYPHTSGAMNAEEAVRLARLAVAAGLPKWVKLEIHPDPRYLLPDPIETLKATEILVKEGDAINAEDPLRGFMPALGRINRYIPPAGPGVRMDSCAYEGGCAYPTICRCDAA